MSGRVVHFEIPCANVERARAFYFAVFGWQLMPLEDMGYTLVTTGPSDESGPTEPGFINGGMYRRRDAFRAPTIVIDVPDIEVALVEVADQGGRTVVARQQVGDLGYTAYFEDSEGNFIGLWETARLG